MDEGEKRVGGVCRRQSVLACEPTRGGEVVHGHDRLEALLGQLAEHIAIVADLLRVELARRRLDTRPLDRQPVIVLVRLSESREVVLVSVVVVVGDRRRIAVRDPARLLLEFRPIAVTVVGLDLVGGAGRAPQESSGETPRHAALTCFSTLGGGTYSQCTGLSPSMSTTSIPALSTALRYISRSLCGRPSSMIHAACSGSAWLTMAIVSPGCSRAIRRITPRIPPPIRSPNSSPGPTPRLPLCPNQDGRRSGMSQDGDP